MTPQIFAYVRHTHGQIDETAAELAVVAKKIDPSWPLVAIVTGCGKELDQACDALRPWYQEVWRIDHASLEHANPELASEALLRSLPQPATILLAHDHYGMDVGPGLSIKFGAAYVPDVVGIDLLERSSLHVVRQEYGGQLNTHVVCDMSSGAVITVRPGAFRANPTVPFSGVIINKRCDLPATIVGRTYAETVQAPAGDVDITKYDVLVSVGRGIQKQENLVLAEALASVLGAAVSCSRPVVDAKWLDKSRQVGSSGKTVRPKVYLACGISGQFQHLAGLKGSPFIIAINKNTKAPIFQVADVGIVADVLEFLPILTEKVCDIHTGRMASATSR